VDRKDFIIRGCHTCLLGAAAIILPHLSGCSPATYNVYKTEVMNNRIEVPLQTFDKNNLQYVRPQGWQYDIAVHRKADGTYAAMLMQCTHMDNQLRPSQNGYTCSLHGSRYDIEGNVVKGPAEVQLKKFSTSVNNNLLIIYI
jgi:Rieske Fe-S protein